MQMIWSIVQSFCIVILLHPCFALWIWQLAIHIPKLPRTGPGAECTLIHLLISALYKLCLFVCVFACLLTFFPVFIPYFLLSLYFLLYLFTSLTVYFLTYLSTSSRIGPFRFQAGGRRRRPILALVFCVHFVLWYILLWMHAWFCCVWFSFSVLSQEIGWEGCLQNGLFCVGWDVKP